MGWSGARIERLGNGEILKSGDASVGDQGLYARYLGSAVCPRIVSVSRTHYTMEELREYDSFHTGPILTLLRERVWSRSLKRPVREWREDLLTWLRRNFDLDYLAEHLLTELYPDDFNDYCVIHGDPTLSNTMLASNGTVGAVRLIDPIRPRGKIPPVADVDVGKMLQSYVGWEVVAFGGAFAKMPSEFVSWLEAPYRRRAAFWLAMHLLRTVPYSERVGRLDVMTWARHGAVFTLDMLYKKEPVWRILSVLRSLTTSTVHWSTLERRS